MTHKKQHDPTPAEIAERAEAIQKEWTKHQRWKHEVERCEPWRVPGSEQVQRAYDAVDEMLADQREEDWRD